MRVYPVPDVQCRDELSPHRPVHFFPGPKREGKPPPIANVKVQVSRQTPSSVIAQVVAGNGILKALSAIKQPCVFAQPFLAAKSCLVTLKGVMVCVHFRMLPDEHKQVGMLAKGERDLILFAQPLFEAAEPGTSALPGIEISIEVVGPERAIIVSQNQVARTETGGEMGVGKVFEVAIIPVRKETRREITGKGQLFRQPIKYGGYGGALLVHTEIPKCRAGMNLGDFRRPGDEVDDATQGVGPVKGRPRAGKNFDTRYRV